jgi:hypothetical protein
MLTFQLSSRGAAWSAQRLRDWIRAFYGGESVVVLAHREPVRHDRELDDDIVIRRSTSGLVTAVEPLIRACSGVWVAHGFSAADRVDVDGRDGPDVPPAYRRYQLHRGGINTKRADANSNTAISNASVPQLRATSHSSGEDETGGVVSVIPRDWGNTLSVDLRGPARTALVTALLLVSGPASADTPAIEAVAQQPQQQQPATRVQSLRRLNTANRFAMPVRTVEALRRIMSQPAMQRDIVRVLEGAGVGSLQADVLRILSEGQVTPPAR